MQEECIPQKFTNAYICLIFFLCTVCMSSVYFITISKEIKKSN